MSKTFKHMTTDEKLNVIYRQQKMIINIFGIKKLKDVREDEEEEKMRLTFVNRKKAKA